MLLDEATSSLDIHHAISVMTILKELVEIDKITVIASIHDLNLACAFCTDLIALKNARIHAHGSVSTLMTDDFVKEIFNVNANIEANSTNGLQVHFQYHT